MLRVVDESPQNEDDSQLVGALGELPREGGRRMLLTALQAEEAAYIRRHNGELAGENRQQVVRAGHARPRSVTMSCGAVEVPAPKVNDRRTEAEGSRQHFTTKLLPQYMRRSPKVAEVLPVLSLRGLVTTTSYPAVGKPLSCKEGGMSADRSGLVVPSDLVEYDRASRRPFSGPDGDRSGIACTAATLRLRSLRASDRVNGSLNFAAPHKLERNHPSKV